MGQGASAAGALASHLWAGAWALGAGQPGSALPGRALHNGLVVFPMALSTLQWQRPRALEELEGPEGRMA